MKNIPKSSRRRRERWVIKVGSHLVFRGGPLLLASWMQQLARLRRQYSLDIIWVSSGAVATGLDRSGFQKTQRSLVEKQALSAIGQPLLMNLYETALQNTGQLGAQILLTYDDMAGGTEKKRLSATLTQLLKWNVIPILNENDATAVEELVLGDNDSLSARVAHMMKADRLVILTDVPGLLKGDLKYPERCELVSYLPKITTQTWKWIAPTKKGLGTGGMASKIKAAEYATRRGVETWLAQGDRPRILEDVYLRKPIGTRIGGPRHAR